MSKINNLIVLTMFLISGCSFSMDKRCEQSKNYTYYNPEEIEIYKNLIIDKKIKSYYLKIIPMTSCENNTCLPYDSNKYDFQELYFDDSTRKGIYTIKLTSKIDDPNCFEIKYSNNKNCYSVTKNQNGKIYSKYHLEKIRKNNLSYVKFVNSENNNILFESSSQSFHIKNFSEAPTGITCISEKKPENYFFDSSLYP